MKSSLFLLSLAAFAGARLASAQEIDVPPIVTEAGAELAPLDVLKQDPVLPAAQGAAKPNGGTGSVVRTLENRLPLPVTDPGRPGELTQLRGLGISAEDTDVEALGVSLNPPQGGGFDLSVFPQYMWSQFRYQLGPSLAVSDPRAVSGSLSLVPWTASALALKGRGARAGVMYSDADITQLSAGAWSDGKLAALAGYTAGDAHGPAGEVSGSWGGSGWLSGRYHLLMSQLDTPTLGPTNFPTPHARQLTARVIPVLEADAKLGDALARTSVFYDWNYIRYDDPDHPEDDSRDHAQQFGLENATQWESWKLGAVFRRISYRVTDLELPAEYFASAQTTKDFDFRSLLVEPTVQLAGTSRYGVLPQGSLGVRQELGPLGLFARGGFARKFPSLSARFYPGPFLEANPGLVDEKVTTIDVGSDYTEKLWSTSLQGYTQRRRDLMIFSMLPDGNFATINDGDGTVYALVHSVTVHPAGWFDLTNGVTWSHSKIDSSGLAFPFLPSILDIASVSGHPSSDDPAWSVGASARFVGRSSTSQPGVDLPGYADFDLEGRSRILKVPEGEVDLSVRVEDVFDRRFEVTQNFPNTGRITTLGLEGQF